jgi:ferredoxin-NADP reductase/MOSC domain-containing protein YiiM
MRLLNFCIGRVQLVDMAGQQVPTAHVKEPVSEPWIVDATGPVGNERALHTAPVYAFSRSHYDHWAKELGRDPDALTDGMFGENLVFDELDERMLRLGDVLAVGDKLKLIVAGPRVPCWKLCWRLGVERTFQNRFAVSARTGIYMGVAEPGSAKPGDRVNRIETDEKAPTVAEIAEYCAAHVVPPLEPVRYALSNPKLNEIVRVVLEAKLSGAERAAKGVSSAWSGWRLFHIARIVAETEDTRSFYLAPVDRAPLPGFRAGQYVQVSGEPINDGEKKRTRVWSLSYHESEPHQYRITVKRQANGGASAALNDQARVGMELKLRAPSGKFILDTGGFRPVALIAAGVGITPLFSMLQAHMERGPDAPPLYLFYGTRNRDRQILRAQLDALLSTQRNLNRFYAFSEPTDRDLLGKDYDHHGRLTWEHVRHFMKGNYVGSIDSPIRVPWYEADFYICGPEGFNKDMRDTLIKGGANADRTFVEHFWLPTEVSAVRCAPNSTIKFVKSNRLISWSNESDLSILELAELEGIVIPNDCRSGVCQACCTTVVDGDVTGSHSEIAGQKRACLCVARPVTGEVTIDA